MRNATYQMADCFALLGNHKLPFDLFLLPDLLVHLDAVIGKSTRADSVPKRRTVFLIEHHFLP